MKLFRHLMIAFGIVVVSLPAMAFQVTGGLTGWWDQPGQQNHGVIITISRLPWGDNTGVVYWAYYDEGSPTWVIAQGELDGDTIDAEVHRFEGISFMQPNDPDANFGERVGTMQVTFQSCATGTVSYDIEPMGPGSFEISRLDTPPGRHCSGGLSDNRRPDLERERIEVILEGEGEATGYAELDLRPARAFFDVSARGLQAGDGYTLQMRSDDDEMERLGEFEVFETGAGTFGEIKFRSPQVGAAENLGFDPRGRELEIRDAAEQLVLAGTLPEEGELPGRGAPPFDNEFKGPGAGGRNVEIQLANVGADSSALATAELSMGGGMEFEIKLIGLSSGDYPVRLNGRDLGTIVVSDAGAGEIEFGYPDDHGQQPFDFDPAGALIEIFDSSELLLFEGVFPEFRGSGGGHGGGGPGGGGPGGGGPGHGYAGSDETQVQFENVIDDGAYAGASAYAEYEVRTNRESFEVEVRSMPVGAYPLMVDLEGTLSEVGLIQVDARGRGEIEFGDPPRFDEAQLDFDPRGRQLEIREDGGDAVFRVDFPD